MTNDTTQSKNSDFSIYSFLYDDVTEEKSGTDYDIFDSVWNLLAVLHFKTCISGYKYLVDIVVRIVEDPDCTVKSAIEASAEKFGVTEQAVFNNIKESIDNNSLFAHRAAILLKRADINDLSDMDKAVEAIGAIYKIYYNYITDKKQRNT